MAVRTRKDVWKLAEWDPILLWYAKAVADMQTRPLNDPTSWRYQAAIHDYDPNNDPLSGPGDTPPTAAERKRFWRQCQHFSWFFLPWHRMYLGFFEQMIMATVKRLGGPADWALPYWNYSDTSNTNARSLPRAFRVPKLPDGSPNALRVEQRVFGANDGNKVGSANAVSLSFPFGEDFFIAAPLGGAPGFGGPRTDFNHEEGDAGAVEIVPHGSMHMAVGGTLPPGWMSSFNTAPLDPIFWLHHCNIDRLWEVWLRSNAQHGNPNESKWLTDIPFDFHDALGATVSMTSSQVVDTTAAPLFYKYEGVPDPLPLPPTEAARELSMKDQRIPEMVGATEKPLTLASETATAVLPVNQPTGPATELAARRRIYVNIENITSKGHPGSYLVYLNLPPDEKPEDHPELYVGLLPMFGVKESTKGTSERPSHGVHYRLEITDVVRTLESRNDWNPQEMRVSFVPEREPSARETSAVTSPAEVGRVSVYYS